MAIVDKCPYCYRPLGVWKHDPILLSDGSKYKWSDDTHLVLVPDVKNRIYKGMYQITETELIELQEHRKALEEELIPEAQRTKFSPINKTGKFQITVKHIKELRDSTEKLLTSMGLIKDDYFNYDEEANKIIHPNGDKSEWFEPSLSADTFQCKNLHIEDLRHNVPAMWMETWEKGTTPGFIETVHVEDGSDPYGYYKEKFFNFNADHDWGGGIDVFVGKWAGGFAGSADSTFELIKSLTPPNNHIKWNGHNRAEAGAGYLCSGQAYSEFSLGTSINKPIIKSTPKTRLQFKGTYDFSWDYHVEGGSLPPTEDPLNFIMITVLWADCNPQYWEDFGVIRYIVPNSIGGAWAALFPITAGEFQNFDRNLYEDYKTIHGGNPPPLNPYDGTNRNIASISIYCYTRSTASTPTWEWGYMWETTNLDFAIDDIKLLYKTV